MTEKRTVSFRLSADLVDWLDEYAREAGASQGHLNRYGGSHGGRDSGKTAIVERLLTACREGRLLEAPPAGQNPFPLEERTAGESPEFPVLISFGPDVRT